MPIIDHFGLLAPSYERFIRPAYPQRLEELLALPAGGSLLDAGGGTGRIAQFLAPRAGICVVADVSQGMLRFAGRKVGVRALRAASEGLPLADGSFDRVIMVDALHHVADAPGTARELWRVLKPGGRLVIEEPDIRTLPVKVIAVFEKLALMRSRFYTGEAIRAMFDGQAKGADIIREDHTVWVVVGK